MRLYFFIFFIFISCSIGETPSMEKKEKWELTQQIDHQTKFNNLDSAMLTPLHVKELSLREKGYSKIPDQIFKFSNLEILDLSLNKIDSIPNAIKELENLKFLLLAYSEVKFITPKINQLKNLENINLLDNQISKIPDEVCSLEKLRKINLAGNKLEGLPDCLCNLKTLKVLGISYRKDEKHLTKEEYLRFKECLPTTFFVYKEMK